MAKMTTKSKIQLWIYKHDDIINSCQYDKTYVWITLDRIGDFIKFCDSHKGDYLSIPCEMQENYLCFTWDNLLKNLY